MKYFTFGMKTMRITQSYNQGNHLPHWKGSKDYADYPIDIAGQDGGRDEYYATVDMEVVAIRGHEQKYTDMIWLVATENCMSPIGEIRPFIALCHWNTDDPYIARLKEGQIIKAGEVICLEGTDGNATGNHLHLVCGDANKGWANKLIKNSNGVWVTNGYCYKPEQIMYINSNFTKIENTQDVSFEVKAIGYNKEECNEDIAKIDDFLANKVKGNTYGDYTEACVSVYKKKKGISPTDGSFIDEETLNRMKEDGLNV